MKLSNLAIFNSKGNEIPVKLYFDIQWYIAELFIDKEDSEIIEYPTGYLDAENNFIVASKGIIKSVNGREHLDHLFENGYIVFSPTVNNDNWTAGAEYDYGLTEDSVSSNPLVYKISDLFNNERESFISCFKELNFETSEKDEFFDLSKCYILDNFSLPARLTEDPLDKFWNLMNTWYPESSKPYWHFETTVELEPVSVGLVSPITLYFLDEYEKNTFRKPFIPIEYDEDGNEIITSLYFATDGDEVKIFVNNKDKAYIDWHNNWTIDLNKSSEYIEPVDITFGFSSEDEGLFLDNVRVYLKRQNKAKDYTEYFYIGIIFFKCKAIGQDERYRTLFSNFGIPDPIEYPHVFKEYDPLEEGNDYELVNRKSKELFLSYDKIFPYVGTYKALINAVKFLGYNDIYFKEWYQFMNIDDVQNLDKVNYVSIDMRTGETLQSKLKRFGFTYEEFLNMHKLNQLTLVYLLNLEQNNDDTVDYKLIEYSEDGTIVKKSNVKTRQLDFPKTIKNFDYASEEVLAKLYYLKQWLEKYIIGVNCRIIDVVGEGIYFEHLKNNAYAVNYLTSDLQKEYSLTPYDVYDVSFEGAKMQYSSAAITASLKEYDYTKFADIKDFKFKDYVKYGHILSNDVSGNIEEQYKLYEYSDFIFYKPENKVIESEQLLGAPIGAPFILDEYLYEVEGSFLNGSMIELNDTFTQNYNPRSKRVVYSIKNNDIATIYAHENELYISDPDAETAIWHEKAPYIKISDGNIRSLSNGKRWNESIMYNIFPVFSENLNRWLYKFSSIYKEKNIDTIISEDYFVFSPIHNEYQPTTAQQNKLNQLQAAYDAAYDAYISAGGAENPDYEEAQQLDTAMLRALDKLNAQKQVINDYIESQKLLHDGRLEYTEDNFYEAPVIKLYNYKLSYVQNGVMQDVRNIETSEIKNFSDVVLEIKEGLICSNEIPVTSSEEVLVNMNFSNSMNEQLYNILNNNAPILYDEPIDEQNEIASGEQYIYPTYTYKTHRQNFYDIDKQIISSKKSDSLQNLYIQQDTIDLWEDYLWWKDEYIRREEAYITAGGSENPDYEEAQRLDIALIEAQNKVTSYTNKAERYKSTILKNTTSADRKIYWTGKSTNILYDDEWCHENLDADCVLHRILDAESLVHQRNANKALWDAYNNLFDQYVTINKNTDIYVNHLGKYTLTCKAYDEYNSIYINHCEDYVNVYGTRPELNAYTIYNKLDSNSQLTNETYIPEKIDVNLIKSNIDSMPVFPRTYRLYGLDCDGSEEITYDNVSYVYDTFHKNDYVLLNNFTNRISGNILCKEKQTILLWKQNYNLNSLNASISKPWYYGIVFYNEKEMRLVSTDILLVQGYKDRENDNYYKYHIQFVNWDNENEHSNIEKILAEYNSNKNIKAFLINVTQYPVYTTEDSSVFLKSDEGNSILKIKKQTSKSVSVFKKNQVVKIVYALSDNILPLYKFSGDNNYIASISYRIKNIYFDEAHNQYLELAGNINEDLLKNHFYNNYKEKYYIGYNSERTQLIYKEILDNITLTVCYANLNPVTYTSRLSYDGWEYNLERAGFVIDSHKNFLNDYIDSGYSAYRSEFDYINAYNEWGNPIEDDEPYYKYPQDIPAIIKSDDNIVLSADDKDKVFNTKNKYYLWTITNNIINNENNILYEFTNQNVFLSPVNKEKYNADIKIRDIFGNILENKGISKFFVI